MPRSTTSPSDDPDPDPDPDPVDDRDDRDGVDKFDDFDDGRSTDADGTPAGAVVARTSSRSSRRGTSAS